ncbi:MAG: hypothetical protein ACODAU_06145 [Myxococcota bacterium]
MARDSKWTMFLAVAVALAGTACDDASDSDPNAVDGGGMGDGGSPDGGSPDGGSPDGGSPDGGDPGPRLFFSTALFGVEPDGQLGVLRLSSSEVRLSEEPTQDTDSVVQWVDGTPLVLERTHGMVAVRSPDDPLTLVRRIDVNPEGTPDGTDFAANPQRVVGVASDRAYVVPQARNELVIIDPRPTGAEEPLDEVDLSAFHLAEDMDGVVDPSDAIRIGDRVYVTLARSWFDEAFEIQFEGSVLAVVDTTDDTLVDMDPEADGIQGIPLDGDVSGGGLVHDPTGDRLLVVAVGAHGELDGGIEQVDLSDGGSDGFVLTEAELGRDVGGLAWVDSTRAYVRLAPELDEELTEVAPSEVRVWDPSTGDLSEETFATDVDGMLVHEGVLHAWSGGEIALYDAASGDPIDSVEVSDLPVFSAAVWP